MSNSCSSVSTRTTPAWRNSSSTATSGFASAAVCEAARASRPAVRPLLTARIGLRARYAPRQPGELAWVAERLEVQQDDVGVGIVLPVLEQIVAADVGLVAERHECRHSEIEQAALGQQLDAHAARLRRESDAAAEPA